ncbi:hypothetical protein M9H77_09897 [Catharanthus roseus]|uniref:Uncharacterized protein n=1 Tax=Catharanthus roseus TaxID=4058 RepID=A0ACC0C227_CATRO|nr:hypothetical protein M9H77_09897 [Catharanthus roseus]
MIENGGNSGEFFAVNSEVGRRGESRSRTSSFTYPVVFTAVNLSPEDDEESRIEIRGAKPKEMAEKLAPEKRHSFVHNGQKVFEWEQTLEEVNIYITLPSNVHKRLFYCKIESKHLEVGIKGNPPYLNHDLTSPVKTDCSYWTLEDDIMHVTLQKREKGQTWSSPIQGQGQLDPYTTDQEQRRLMLQRFQEEEAILSEHRNTWRTLRTQVLTSHKPSSQGVAPIQGPSWVAYAEAIMHFVC